MKRREAIRAFATLALGAGLPGGACAGQAQSDLPIRRNGRIKQGLWPVNFGLPSAPPAAPSDRAKELERMCEVAVRVGAVGFDILPPPTWPVQRAHGLTPTLAPPGPMDFDTGIVHVEAHDSQLAAMISQARLCANAGVRRIGINAGMRRGLSYAEAATNAIALLNRLKDQLEKLDVMVCLENVNDRRRDPDLGRPDMAFGHWDWGMDVVTRVDSPQVKLLCDIYHLQIMDGDVAWRIRESIGSIGHFHVAGVPGRAEIDDTQELNFRFIAQVIAALPYDGYVSHEWSPAVGHDPVRSIEQAIATMDV
jgi:hydroxypyruvate isomerase